MIGRKQELNLQFLQILDGVLLAFVFWVAHTIRFMASDLFLYDRPIGPFRDFQWLLFIILPFAPIILEMQGFYGQPLQKTVGRSLRQIASGCIGLGLLIAACAYFLRLEVPSRAVMPMFFVLGVGVLMLRERLTLLQLRTKAQGGEFREPVLLAGAPEDIQQFRRTIAPDALLEMEICEEVDISAQPISYLVQALHRHSASRVIFAGGHSQLNRLEEAIAACEIEGVEAWLTADFIRTSIARPTFDVLGSRPMLVFRTTPEISWALLFKDLIDRLGALFGLTIFAVPMLIIAALIRATSPGPVIFRQKRGGRHGRAFTMFKFRTMVTDAPALQAELAARNEMSGPVFKITEDPRITPIGRFLRRTSLDELPQFFNVLRGEMSLVGPRPLPVYEVERFESASQRRRLSMKPGLTCLWQISGRNKIQKFDDWVRLDLQYIDNWSIWLDLKILFLTVPVVLFGWGAK